MTKLLTLCQTSLSFAGQVDLGYAEADQCHATILEVPSKMFIWAENSLSPKSCLLLCTGSRDGSGHLWLSRGKALTFHR